jgi:hypothetical protein
MGDKSKDVYTEYIRDQYGSGRLTQLPGCCGVVVSHNSFIYTKSKRQGHGDRLHKLRVSKAIDKKFGVMIATVLEDNHIEQKILINNDWFLVHTFKNPKTNRNIQIWCRNVNQKDRV